ncbi:MAG: hypothetical protein OSA23_10805 [Rhodospirillales bacterium]|nr:hypothetical protein [Rhodospirillales bacterium]
MTIIHAAHKTVCISYCFILRVFMSTGFLSNDDIAKLTADPSPDSRAETAAKIAVGFDCGKLSDKEHGLAKETRDARFTLLIKEG